MRIRLFVASPGDVRAERDSLNTVVNELNRTCAALLLGRDVRLELVRWETHAYPAMGRPQGVINEQLPIEDYDIFIGIMWLRFGSATGRSDSGTEEEFRLALKSWQQTKRPHIMFYFSNSRLSPRLSLSDLDQLNKVIRFRSEVEQLGLVWDYTDSAAFPDTVRPHLLEVVGRLVRIEGDTLGGVQARNGEDDSGDPELPMLRGSQDILPGDLVRIIDIHPDDSWYSKRDSLNGKTGRIKQLGPEGEDGWRSGSLTLEPKPADAAIPERVFYRFKTQKA